MNYVVCVRVCVCVCVCRAEVVEKEVPSNLIELVSKKRGELIGTIYNVFLLYMYTPSYEVSICPNTFPTY